MKLSIIIPCYNEDQTIKALLDALFQVDFPIPREIIVVDDGSIVNHRNFIKEEIEAKKIRFIRLSSNQGKGIAIRVGLKYAIGDIFIIQDADFEYFPTDIPRLLQPILNREVDVVYGTRFSQESELITSSHSFGNALLTFLTNLLYNQKLTDMETGYKLFTRKVLNKINFQSREFEFEPEITANMVMNGFKIKELPIKYKYRSYGYAKINWLDGIESALVLLKYRIFQNSKTFDLIYRIYKFHFKKIINKISKNTIYRIIRRI